jgi:hypothetical protein
LKAKKEQDAEPKSMFHAKDGKVEVDEEVEHVLIHDHHDHEENEDKV